MKKIVLALAGTALLAVSLACCANSSDGAAGLALVGGITNGGATNGGSPTDGSNTGAQPGGGATTGGIPDVLINASNLKYIGEGTETIDSVEYKVKKYADVIVDNPYFYTYYKLYYLNDKLRRVYRFEHGIGSAMDYKYYEFVEHTCGVSGSNDDDNVGLTFIYTYHENGSLASYTIKSKEYPIAKIERYYYPSGKKKLEINHQGMPSICYYFESGYVKYSFTIVGSTVGSTAITNILDMTGTLYTFDDGVAQNYITSGTPSSSETCTAAQARAKLLEEAKK